jgi:hypothetical protein
MTAISDIDGAANAPLVNAGADDGERRKAPVRCPSSHRCRRGGAVANPLAAFRATISSIA